MTYSVDISVEGFFNWTGDAANEEEARQLAIDAACDADFGELHNIDFDVYQVEEE